MTTITTIDGLTYPLGVADVNEGAGVISTDNYLKSAVIKFNFDKLPGFTSDLNRDGTLDGFNNADFHIPANSTITRCFVRAITGFTSGATPTLNVGTYTIAGAAIDADGLVAAAALTTINAAGKLVAGAGAQLNVSVGTADAYIVIASSAAYTAGKGELFIEYI
jgi:hypothetical protein